MEGEEKTKTEEKKAAKVPFYKKWWFWVIIALVVLGAIGGAVGGTDSSKDDSTDGSTASKSGEYKIEDEVKVGNLTYKVTSVYDTIAIGGADVTSNDYVVIGLEITNNGSSEATVTANDLLYYRGNSSYKYNSLASLYADNGFYINVKIGAQITKQVTIVFEIPSVHQSTDYLKVKGGLLSSAKIYMKE